MIWCKVGINVIICMECQLSEYHLFDQVVLSICLSLSIHLSSIYLIYFYLIYLYYLFMHLLCIIYQSPTYLSSIYNLPILLIIYLSYISRLPIIFCLSILIYLSSTYHLLFVYPHLSITYLYNYLCIDLFVIYLFPHSRHSYTGIF